MFKKLFTLAAVAAVALLFSGCSTVTPTNKFNGLHVGEGNQVPVAHINAKITGFYLLYFIPICSGDPVVIDKTSMFQDNVKLWNAMDMATLQAKKMGASRVIDVYSKDETTYLSGLFFFWTKTVEVTCTAVK